MRSATHLARLELALATLPSDRAKEVARGLDATLEPHSVFWGITDEGDSYVEWGGVNPSDGSHPSWMVRLYGF